MIRTGYYGNERQTVSAVHVTADGKPICGYKPAASMKFQWCASGVVYSYVNCKRCQRKLKTHLIKLSDSLEVRR